LIVVVTTPSPGLAVGQRSRVVGTRLEAAGPGISFLEEKPGRPATAADAPPKPRRAGTRREAWPDDYPERARELRAQGHSTREIGAELGIPFSTAKWWLSAAGRERAAA
jgi:DNA invertase Pin-like site-specific DNA recombinase